MEKFPFEDWRCEQLRLTVFPMATDLLREPKWWDEMMGAEPDETTMHPKKGTGLVQGGIEDGKLLLRLEADRIDWVLAPPDLNESSHPSGFGDIGNAPDALKRFSEFCEHWLTKSKIPLVNRMAVGGVLLHPESDKKAAYERLMVYLGITMDPESSDFLYQINRPNIDSQSGIEGLRLNRLSKWSASAWRTFAVELEAQAGGYVKDLSPSITATRLELDINTLPTYRKEIPHDRLSEIFHELVHHFTILATEGLTGNGQ